MNIRNTVRKLSLLGGAAALPVLATMAMAGSSVNLQSNTATLGDAGKSSGWTSACDSNSGICADVATGTGFRQETIAIGGSSFVRTVVAETGTEGDFGMETYVQMGGTDGLRGKQLVTDPNAVSFNTEGFYMEAALDTGWANTSKADGVTINQSIVDTTDNFAVQFKFHENATDLGAPTDGSLDNKQVLQGQQVGDQNGEHQNFTLVENEGNVPSGFVMTVGGTTFNGTNASGLIEVLWIGTNLGATFGLEDVKTQNPALEVGNDRFNTPGFTGTSPITEEGFDWDTALGTSPYQPSF